MVEIIDNFLTNLQYLSIETVLTMIIIFGIGFFFSAQIWAWVTPPNPKFLHALGCGTVAGAILVFIIYLSIPLAPALINASLVGVYGYWGYAWVLSILFLLAIFMINTWNAWKEDRPLEVIQ